MGTKEEIMQATYLLRWHFHLYPDHKVVLSEVPNEPSLFYAHLGLHPKTFAVEE